MTELINRKKSDTNTDNNSNSDQKQIHETSSISDTKPANISSFIFKFVSIGSIIGTIAIIVLFSLWYISNKGKLITGTCFIKNISCLPYTNGITYCDIDWSSNNKSYTKNYNFRTDRFTINLVDHLIKNDIKALDFWRNKSPSPWSGTVKVPDFIFDITEKGLNISCSYYEYDTSKVEFGE